MKKIIVVMGLIFFLVGCGKKTVDTYSTLVSRGYIIMGMDETFAPMGFRDEGGNIVGFDPDLAEEVSKEIGLEIKFQPIDWSSKEQELSSGKIDLIWNGYSVTDERKEKVNFSNTYLENRQIIITLDEEIKSILDLEGKFVGVQNGSSTLNAINRSGISEKFKGGEPVLFDTNLEAFIDMELGRTDAVVADEVLARYYISKKDEASYRILDDDFGKEEYGIGIRKEDQTLLEEINNALDKMKINGKYDEIYNKWFK